MKWLWAFWRFLADFAEAIQQEDRDREAHRQFYQAFQDHHVQRRSVCTGNTELDPVTGREIPKQSEL